MLCSKEGNVLEKPRDISQCLQHYFNFPASLLEKPLVMCFFQYCKFQVLKICLFQRVTNSKWKERPLKNSRKTNCSLLATYLITLKVQLETLLLQKYYKAVDFYSTHLKNMSLYNATQNINTRVPDELNNLLK